MELLTIAGRAVGPGLPPYVIAEIGSNHNGDMELCRRLIDAAHAAGADAVKFQSWTRRSLISSAEYDRNTRYAAERKAPPLVEAVERYQMTADRMHEAADYGRSQGIVWFASCFSAEEVELLESLDAPAYKIASMDPSRGALRHGAREAAGERALSLRRRRCLVAPCERSERNRLVLQSGDLRSDGSRACHHAERELA